MKVPAINDFLYSIQYRIIQKLSIQWNIKHENTKKKSTIKLIYKITKKKI